MKQIPQVKSVNYGLESIQVLRPKIWESFPNNLKKKESIESFKTAIKRWKPESCPCRRLWKTYRTWRLVENKMRMSLRDCQ